MSFSLSFNNFRSAVVIGTGILATLWLAGCSQPPPPPAQPPIAVVAGTPLRTPIVEWDEYVGRIEPIEFVEVRARVSGYLDATHFQEGQIVREGDLLSVIDQRPFAAEVARTQSDVVVAQSQVEQAKATVAQTEAEVKLVEARHDLASKQHDRSKRLAAQNAVSQDEFEVRESEFTQSQASLKAARAKLDLAKASADSAAAAEEAAKSLLAVAKLNLEYCEIRAPITGRISSRLVTEGNLISGGTPQSTILTTIVSLDPIYCHFDADEQSFLKYVRLVRDGKLDSPRQHKLPVHVGVMDQKDQFPHHGHMDFVDNRLDPETATMRGRAILPNSDLSLTPGLFARVRLPGSSRYDAILVPDLAIGTDQSDKFVFVIESDGSVRRQVVELGPMARGLRIVRNGLQGTESIVLRGLQRIRPDSKVTAKTEVIAMKEDGLPDDARSVPEDQWLTRPKHNRPLATGAFDSRNSVTQPSLRNASLLRSEIKSGHDFEGNSL